MFIELLLGGAVVLLVIVLEKDGKNALNADIIPTLHCFVLRGASG
jgi:uncharacterized membrane protein (GlpM family)